MKRSIAVVVGVMAAFVAAAPASAVWTPPQRVDRAHPAWDLSAAANRHGLAVLAWRANHPRVAALRARFRTPAGRLGALVTFRRPGWSVGEPAVAIAGSGAAAVTWLEWREREGARSGRRIVVARRAPGGRWRAPTVIGRSGKSTARPLVAISDRGEMMVAWRYDRRFQAAFAASPARPFGRPRFVGAGQQHALGYDDRGRAILVWASYPAAGRLQVAQSPARARRFGRVSAIPRTAPASEPALAATPGGGLAIAYKAAPNNGTEFKWGPIAVTTRARTGAFSTPRTISVPDTSSTAGRPPTFAGGPAIAAARGGTLVAAWQQVRGGAVGSGEYIAAATASSSSAPFTAPITLGPAGQFDLPSVAVDAAGTAAVVWRQVQDGRAWASVRPPGSSFLPATPISTGPVGYAPRLATGGLLACLQEGGSATVTQWHGTS
jgi:hypothetical protein